MSADDRVIASRDIAVETNKDASPSKISKEVIGKMRGALQIGATHEIAAQYAGIGVATFYRWMKKGREQKSGIFREFYDIVKSAEAAGDIVHLNVINDAARNGDWRASKYLLQARHPEYRDDVTVRHSGEKPGEPIKIQPVPLDFSKMADDELSSLERLLEKARGAIENAAQTALESPDSDLIDIEV